VNKKTQSPPKVIFTDMMAKKDENLKPNQLSTLDLGENSSNNLENK